MIKYIPSPYDRINTIYDISEEKPEDKSESSDVACSPMRVEGDKDKERRNKSDGGELGVLHRKKRDWGVLADVAIISGVFSLHTMVFREYVFCVLIDGPSVALFIVVTCNFFFLYSDSYRQCHAGFRTSNDDPLVLRGTF